MSFYNIKKAEIFERKMFEFTGTNVCICFFETKSQPSQKPVVFQALKTNRKTTQKEYHLLPRNFYRACGEFDEYVLYFKSPNLLKIKFYLTIEEVAKNKRERKLNF